jgi:hypothetical protein
MLWILADWAHGCSFAAKFATRRSLGKGLAPGPRSGPQPEKNRGTAMHPRRRVCIYQE